MGSNNTRQTALDILTDVLQRGSYANLALKYGLDGMNSDLDKRFIAALVYGTVDNLIHIDFILDGFIKRNKTSEMVLNILRLGVCQLMFMDKVPDYSVCSESVALAKANADQKVGNLVNAVLRNIIRNRNNIKYPDEKTEPIKYLSVKYSYPEWIVKMWIDDYGYDTALGLLSYQPDTRSTSIRLNCARLSNKHFETLLDRREVKYKKGKYLPNIYYINASGISDSELYKEGFYTVQSESSMLCVEAACPKPDTNVLDACSAPGGKALYAAEKMENRGSITACDIHKHKLELINKNADRLGYTLITTEERDSSVNVPEYVGKFDLVFADVPCSGLGVTVSKPDIKLQKTSEVIGELSLLQYAILENVASYVKPNGTLIYSTCTVSGRENGGVVKRFLKKHAEFEAVPIELKGFEGRGTDGKLQIMPHVDGIEGFFIAKFRRKEQ